MLALSSLNTDQTGSPDCPIARLRSWRMIFSVTFKRVHLLFRDEQYCILVAKPHCVKLCKLRLLPI